MEIDVTWSLESLKDYRSRSKPAIGILHEGRIKYAESESTKEIERDLFS